MKYQTYKPHPDLEAFVQFYWTLEVPFDANNERQKILPDGCIEMTFNFGAPIRRYTTENEFVLHPGALIMGQRTKPIYIEPTGDVDSFAVSFYPFGFANFVDAPLGSLVDTETAISEFFGTDAAHALEEEIVQAAGVEQRIAAVERFLLSKLGEEKTIGNIVRTTVDALLATNGNSSIRTILKDKASKRRQLERKFLDQIGISPKQLGKVIRLQTALRMMLSEPTERLTDVAYESGYFDQAHFIKDFREFTGGTPKEFLGDDAMALSTLFYSDS